MCNYTNTIARTVMYSLFSCFFSISKYCCYNQPKRLALRSESDGFYIERKTTFAVIQLIKTLLFTPFFLKPYYSGGNFIQISSVYW